MRKLLCLRDGIEAIAACHDGGDVWDRYCWVYVTDDVPLVDAQLYLSTAKTRTILPSMKTARNTPPSPWRTGWSITWKPPPSPTY